MKKLWNLSVKQIDLIAQLSNTKGIRELARRNSTDPAAISRLLKEVEEIFGFKLAIRNQKGLLLTAEGQEIVRMAKNFIGAVQSFEDVGPSNISHKEILSYVLGSRGFFATLVAEQLAKTPIEKSKARFKFVDSSPSELLESCLAGWVDIAIHFEKWDWPSSWITKEVGDITWGVVARREHPIPKNIELVEIQKFPFIPASYLSFDRVERASDSFPLSMSQRWLGHEAQTAFTSKAIVLGSNHIAFLPLVTMFHEIMAGTIKVITVRGMNPVQMPLRLSYNQDRISQSVEKLVLAAVSEIYRCDKKLSVT